jgi:hypothetical protein
MPPSVGSCSTLAPSSAAASAAFDHGDPRVIYGPGRGGDGGGVDAPQLLGGLGRQHRAAFERHGSHLHDDVAWPDARRRDEPPVLGDAQHLAHNDRLGDHGGDLGVATDERRADRAQCSAHVGEQGADVVFARRRGEEDGGEEPARTDAHHCDVVGAYHHGEASDLAAREGDGVGRRDEHASGYVDGAGVLAEGRAESDLRWPGLGIVQQTGQ